MRSSIFVSLTVFCLLVTACAPLIRSGCAEAQSEALTRADMPSVITAADSLRTFDIEISFFGKRFNGFLLVKRQGRETVRMLINSYFGMSMADFEISADTFTVHYLFSAMNKPAVVKIFENDFRLLFGFHLPEQFTARKLLCEKSEVLFVYETVKGKCQYRINAENQNIIRLKAPGVKVNIPSAVYPRTVILKHSNIFSPTIVIKELE